MARWGRTERLQHHLIRLGQRNTLSFLRSLAMDVRGAQSQAVLLRRSCKHISGRFK